MRNLKSFETLVDDIVKSSKGGIGRTIAEEYADTQLYQYEDYEDFKKNGISDSVYSLIRYGALNNKGINMNL